jgi:LmbE family N-acetylglucosaminyl deacetylase
MKFHTLSPNVVTHTELECHLFNLSRYESGGQLAKLEGHGDSVTTCCFTAGATQVRRAEEKRERERERVCVCVGCTVCCRRHPGGKEQKRNRESCTVCCCGVL